MSFGSAQDSQQEDESSDVRTREEGRENGDGHGIDQPDTKGHQCADGEDQG